MWNGNGLEIRSLWHACSPQPSEFGLQLRRVGEADPAQGSDAKVRRDGDQLADRFHGLFALAETDAAERQDAIGKGEVAISFDRLARVRHGVLIPAGKQTSQGMS